MRPTRPSIMSDGATMSAPAAACDSAARTSCSTVGVVGDFSPSTRRPQWPCDVYSQRQTSVTTSKSGDLLLERAHRGLHGRLRVVRRRSPLSSFASGSPNSSTPGTPSALAAAASLTTSSTDSWKHAGHRRDFARAGRCRCTTNSGYRNMSGLSRVSRTSDADRGRSPQPPEAARADRAAQRRSAPTGVRIGRRACAHAATLGRSGDPAAAAESARPARRPDPGSCTASGITVVRDAELLRGFGRHRADRRDDRRRRAGRRPDPAPSIATKFLTVDGARERHRVDLAIEQHPVDVGPAVALGAGEHACDRRRRR